MSEKVLKGIIIKGIGGFYYIEADGDIYECKARGAFRKKKISPLAGDNVIITVRENGENTIDEIEERKNFLVRPPVANVDTLVIVSSVKEPVPSLAVIDRLTAIAVSKNIKPCVVFSKSDLGDTTEFEEIYKKSGIEVCSVCCKTGEGVEIVKSMIKGGITVFTGNTGVGKSSLLNCIDSRFSIETGEVSSKLGRGRHTTRDVTLHKIQDFYVADTPGFSSLEIEGEPIDIATAYHDFKELSYECKFRGCLHDSEPHCAIKEAVESGKISQERYDHYLMFLKEAKENKEKRYG